MKTVCLSDFVENPANPSTVTDEAFARLVGKLRRVPDGLAAHRIAYVTDNPAGRFVVLAGNKRLRALKQIHGASARVPAAWFQDVTSMSPDQRREFLVSSNVNDGAFDADKLLKLFEGETSALGDLMDPALLDSLIAQADEATTAALADAANEEVVLSLTLPSADYAEAVAFLRRRDDDISRAFMEVVNERA